MAKNNLNIWIIVLIVIVVAVLATLITNKMTGNVIKQINNPYGNYKVYTTTEVDAKLNSVNSGVLGMLNKCKIVVNTLSTNQYLSCNNACALESNATNQNLICTVASIVTYQNANDTIGHSLLWGCKDIGEPKKQLRCLCCSA